MRKKKQIRRIKNDGLLSRVYEDFKNNQKNREKKEIKFREEQLEKNQEKLKLKERELKLKDKECLKRDEELKLKEEKLKHLEKEQKQKEDILRLKEKEFNSDSSSGKGIIELIDWWFFNGNILNNDLPLEAADPSGIFQAFNL